ncbi:DUF308 domain-containing protein [Halostella sp. PRR32]|uniref:DUF308 domain-containing protein n=1 Tax=Halostella sp. PRR32 TaxID=3098147 RepID=UPI002B1D6212|nr:DUF308 domain-containing protein [Halostella sp. PRR32]
MGRRISGLVATIGIVTAALGFVLVFVPEYAGLINAPNAFVTIVGAIALLQGFRAVQLRRRKEVVEFETPDPETRPTLPTPGDELGHNLRSHDRRHSDRQKRIDERLETAAIEGIVYAQDCSEDEARDALERGTWTDDPIAAAFFTDHVPESTPVLTRIRHTMSFRLRFDRQRRHAAHAIADLHGVDRE